MMNKIKLIAVVGKAGSGKDYLSSKWTKERDCHKVVSSTTRPKRDGEVEGVDYHFLPVAEFMKSSFLEQTKFRGWHYGTRLEDLNPEKANIGVFNPEAVYQLAKSAQIDLIIVYVEANDKTRLLRQLLREQDPVVREIIRRWESDTWDFADFDEWIEFHKEINVIHYDNN